MKKKNVIGKEFMVFLMFLTAGILAASISVAIGQIVLIYSGSTAATITTIFVCVLLMGFILNLYMDYLRGHR